MDWYERMQRRIRLDLVLRILYFVAFAGITALIFWKCKFGFGNMDETFYLTMPWRFLQGDRIVLHEWHIAQFSGFTMIPLMWIYSLFTSSMDGVVLAFRYIYTFSWCAACLYFDLRLRKIHRIGAGFASLMLLAYVPYGMMALSYNSLVLLYLMNAIVLLLCAERRQKLQFTLSGLFFAGAVLCCPYLVVIYVLASLGLLFAKLLMKRPRIPFHQADCYLAWRWFTLGAAILAVVFLATLLSGASLQQIVQSLTLSLEDPEYSPMTFSEKVRDYYIETVRFNGYIRPLLLGLLVVFILTLIRRSALWPAAVCGMVGVYLWKFVKPDMIMNYLMYPLSYAGIYVLLVTKESRTRWLGWLWLVPGILGTVCLCFGSTQGFYAISNGAVISSLAGVMMLWMYVDEMRQVYQTREKGKLLYLAAPLAALVLMLYQLGVEIPVRYESVYWEPGLMEDAAGQVEILEGPEKGVIASQAYAEEYLQTWRDVKDIQHLRVLFLSHQTWLPLVNDNENAAFSAWLSVYLGMNDATFDRLDAYYALCPEKKPELIFLDRRYADQVARFDPEKFEVAELESGSYLIRPKSETSMEV